MKIKIFSIFLIIASILQLHDGYLQFSTILTVVRVLTRGLNYLYASKNHKNSQQLSDIFTDDKSKVIITKLDDIRSKLEDMDVYLRQELSGMNFILNNLGAQNVIDDKKSDLLKSFTLIEDYYKRFLYYKSLKDITDSVMRVFADEVILHVLPAVSEIHGIVAPGGNFGGIEEGLAYRIAENFLNMQSKECDRKQSPQFFLANFLLLVLTAEVQALTILSNSYFVKFNRTSDAYIDIDRLFSEFRTKLENYRQHFNESLSITSRAYRSCDPKQGFQLDVTYYQFREVYRPAIGTCKAINFGELPKKPGFLLESTTFLLKTCEKCPPEKPLNNTRAQCSGAYSECQSVGWVQACVHESGVPRFSSLKFGPSAILSTSTLYGSSGDCRGAFIYPKTFLGVADTYQCMCRCFPRHRDLEKIDSDAVYILSMQRMSADVGKNQIITGIGFTRIGFVIGIKIKIGVVSADGNVTTPNNPWIEPTNFTDFIIRKSTKNTGKSCDLFDCLPEDSPLVLVNDNMYFHLGKFTAKPHAVITSVAFDVVPSESRKLVTLDIISHKLDYISGELSNLDTVLPERDPINVKILVTSNRSVITTEFPYKPDSDDYDQVKLEVSSMEDDIGQTMVPFFDGVTVESSPPTPLNGLQLYHKSAVKSVGFLSWRLISIDYRHNFEDLFDNILSNEIHGKKTKIA